jgi:hypothetical protein
MVDPQPADDAPEIPEGHLAIRVHLVMPEEVARAIAPSIQTRSCIEFHPSVTLRRTGVPAPLEHLLSERGEEQAGG